MSHAIKPEVLDGAVAEARELARRLYETLEALHLALEMCEDHPLDPRRELRSTNWPTVER